MTRHHAVGYQAPIAQIQNKLSWLDFVRVPALDDQLITGPHRREHAAPGHFQSYFSERSHDLECQIAFHFGASARSDVHWVPPSVRTPYGCWSSCRLGRPTFRRLELAFRTLARGGTRASGKVSSPVGPPQFQSRADRPVHLRGFSSITCQILV